YIAFAVHSITHQKIGTFPNLRHDSATQVLNALRGRILVVNRKEQFDRRVPFRGSLNALKLEWRFVDDKLKVTRGQDVHVRQTAYHPQTQRPYIESCQGIDIRRIYHSATFGRAAQDSILHSIQSTLSRSYASASSVLEGPRYSWRTSSWRIIVDPLASCLLYHSSHSRRIAGS